LSISICAEQAHTSSKNTDTRDRNTTSRGAALGEKEVGHLFQVPVDVFESQSKIFEIDLYITHFDDIEVLPETIVKRVSRKIYFVFFAFCLQFAVQFDQICLQISCSLTKGL
jgi:hypothetical protein